MPKIEGGYKTRRKSSAQAEAAFRRSMKDHRDSITLAEILMELPVEVIPHVLTQKVEHTGGQTIH